MKKLTPKQQKFADNYIETGNLYQSAIEAGYSTSYARSSASKLLENVGIKSYIDKRMKEIANNNIMDAREAVELLTRIARGEEEETVIVGTPDGLEETTKEADLKTRISAIKEILKRYPGNDKLVEQQVRKLTAEADVAEAKAKAISEANNSKDSTLIVDDVKEADDD